MIQMYREVWSHPINTWSALRLLRAVETKEFQLQYVLPCLYTMFNITKADISLTPLFAPFNKDISQDCPNLGV